jgi:hypothetical protein
LVALGPLLHEVRLGLFEMLHAQMIGTGAGSEVM